MSGLMLRRRAMIQKCGATPGLPNEYQQVEWISRSNSSSDNGNIDTGFIPTPKSSIFARFAAIGSQSNKNLLGSRDASTGANKAFLIVSFSSAHKIGFMRWGSSVQCIPYDNDFHDYELTPSTAKIDGVSYTLATPVASQSSSQSIYFFREWNGGMFTPSHNIKLAYCSLWEDGVKTNEFIPCYRKADGAIGVYDLVGETFLIVTGYGANPQKGDDVN